MDALLKSEIFFVISSIGFIVLTILLTVFLVYLIIIAHKFVAISETIKKKAEEIGEAITDAKDFVAEGGVVHWMQYLFGSRKKSSRSKRSQDKVT
jgi:hypothetical protein